MNDNPFKSPVDGTDGQKPAEIQFREFTAQGFSFHFSTTAYRNEIRARVQTVIANQIGVENVVSITEHVEALGTFSVVVWYRK